MARHRLKKPPSTKVRTAVAVAGAVALAGGATVGISAVTPVVERTGEFAVLNTPPDIPRTTAPPPTTVITPTTSTEPARTPVKAPEVAPKALTAKPATRVATSPDLVSAARKYLGRGIQYVWGGKSLSTGFDCSGFIWQVLKDTGHKVGYRTADGLKDWATPVSAANAKPGDLVFWSTGGRAYHVEIYIGGGKSLGSANPQIDIGIHDIHGSPSYGRIPS